MVTALDAMMKPGSFDDREGIQGSSREHKKLPQVLGPRSDELFHISQHFVGSVVSCVCEIECEAFFLADV